MKPAAQQSPPSARPAAMFLALIVLIGVFGLIQSAAAPRMLSGLPDVPEAHEAARLLGGRLRVVTGGLRLETALMGENREGHAFSAEDVVAANRAEALLAAARTRTSDPRLDAASASLALARRQLARAEAEYQQIVARAGGYGEARLGYGVALALRAETLPDPRRRRAMNLRSIAQFANVHESDPVYPIALYDRILLLARVGRGAEARALRAHYRVLDPGSEWDAALARAIEAGAS